MNRQTWRANLWTVSLAVQCAGGWLGHAVLSAELAPDQPPAATRYHSPNHLAVAPDGKTLYVADATWAAIVLLDTGKGEVQAEIPLHGEPRGICLVPDGTALFVAERGAGTVAVIDTGSRSVTTRIPVDRCPVAVALAPRNKRLYVGCEDTHRVWVIDLSQHPFVPLAQVGVVREPSCLAVTTDERWVVVTNRLPDGAGTDPTLSAVVSILDAATLTQAAAVKLPTGSTAVNGACTSPDGKWAYVVHSLGRFHLPITQLERGWVNTFALSILDPAQGTRLATVLLDELTQGAADPHTVVCDRDGTRLWISHAGVHEVSMVEIGGLHQLLQGQVPEPLASLQDGMQENIWVKIQRDAGVITDLENDLTALYIAGLIRRSPTGGNGPRGLAFSPDEERLYVANYYSGTIAELDAERGSLLGSMALGKQPPADSRRRGEAVFHDATKAFQRWHSCASCHPNQGRVDGLRWDFLRDGIGNAKDTINLVYAHLTPPLNRLATRQTIRECVLTGMTSGHMLVPAQQDVDDVVAYLIALRPEPSPYLTATGSLSDAAVRGKALFEGRARCAGCHPAPYFTDQKSHDVGMHSATDARRQYDTPSLLEAYRTAPYLHDGRARTIRDVLTSHNAHDQHGKTTGLSVQEVEDLVSYVLSL